MCRAFMIDGYGGQEESDSRMPTLFRTQKIERLRLGLE